jgi:hypothetical protein
MGMRNNHTKFLTYPEAFNKTLEETEPYIQEAQTAVDEAKTLNEMYKGFQKGRFPLALDSTFPKLN